MALRDCWTKSAGLCPMLRPKCCWDRIMQRLLTYGLAASCWSLCWLVVRTVWLSNNKTLLYCSARFSFGIRLIFGNLALGCLFYWAQRFVTIDKKGPCTSVVLGTFSMNLLNFYLLQFHFWFVHSFSDSKPSSWSPSPAYFSYFLLKLTRYLLINFCFMLFG